jgi:putative phosphoribosyl transferase
MEKTYILQNKEVTLEDRSKSIVLKGILTVPKGAKCLVVFAHGSGSSRHSPRNKFVASIFSNASMGTLLIDLLMPEEEKVDNLTREHRFDIGLLADRLNFATDWLVEQPQYENLNIGYIGSSTGAAAALVAAAVKSDTIKAVVSRGGRPDLASNYLTQVKAPTLLIIGSLDFDVIKLNQQAFELLACEKKMEIVANATHLFEEPGTLEEAAYLAKDWFLKYL